VKKVKSFLPPGRGKRLKRREAGEDEEMSPLGFENPKVKAVGIQRVGGGGPSF